MGRSDVLLKTLKPELFADEKVRRATVKDILAELEKPGRDPRPDFKVARFNDGVEDIKDLQGRHDAGRHGEQRGRSSAPSSTSACTRTAWCTSSQLSDKFVKDAREVVKTGDIVKVKVLEVDVRASASQKRRAPSLSYSSPPSI
jgi:uncharacterized protein